MSLFNDNYPIKSDTQGDIIPKILNDISGLKKQIDCNLEGVKYISRELADTLEAITFKLDVLQKQISAQRGMILPSIDQLKTRENNSMRSEQKFSLPPIGELNSIMNWKIPSIPVICFISESLPRKSSKERICFSCGSTESPQWRRGPHGPGTLCNSCGLRLSKRQRKLKREIQIRQHMNEKTQEIINLTH